ncbi:MAG: tetratricopeptide repeat protein [Bacteroidales bacterium]|nr:tetratricopeptide repeat protein [Bacteroidales bacterium]
MDLSGAVNGRKDLNGNPCALLVVLAESNGVKFSGNVIGDVEYKDYKYYVYMSAGSKQLMITFPTSDSEIISFSRYGIDKLEGKQTYTLKVELHDYKLVVQEGPIEEALKYYAKGQFNFAMGLFLSEPDNVVAQHHIGAMYLYGEGVPKDEEKGLSWIRKAVENNDADAMADLGYYMLKQNSTPAAFQEGMDLCVRAGELGNMWGYHYLGAIYRYGEGVDINYIKAKEFYEKAIDMGNGVSANSLGVMYMHGLGVKCDYAKALDIFSKSIYNANARYNEGLIYYNGWSGERNFDLAFKKFSAAADMKDATSCGFLGVMYYNGEGVDKNYEMAFQWLKKAQELGEDRFLTLLGICYYNGYGVERDMAKAKEFLTKAAEAGDEQAADILKKII